MKRLLIVAGVVVVSACGSMQQLGDRDALTREVRKTVGVHQVALGSAIAMSVDAVKVAGSEADVIWTESTAAGHVQSKQHYTRSPAGQWLATGTAVELARDGSKSETKG